MRMFHGGAGRLAMVLEEHDVAEALSFFRSLTRSRNARSTSSISFSGMSARVFAWSAPSMMISCAPTPFVFFIHAIAVAVERALDAQRGKLVGHDVELPGGAAVAVGGDLGRGAVFVAGAVRAYAAAFEEDGVARESADAWSVRWK